MSSLRAPGLGPIVGHTTTNACRLWIRAGDPEDKGVSLSSERRTVGVLMVLKKNDTAIPEPPVFY
ncbi:MAG: alkaline phosphatase family protein, partial [Alphaproteobacteria bacterium]